MEWPDEVKAFILANADSMTDEQMAAAITGFTGRVMTRTALRKQRQRLGVRKMRGRGVIAVDHRRAQPPDKKKKK